MKKILFLCTGNYYRSRFCEAYFNHQAAARGLEWRAESRGLAPNVAVFGNLGPIAPKTLEALKVLGVPVDENPRYPLAATNDDFARADRVIALSQDEHQVMVERYFPAYWSTVEYWEVGDIHIETPVSAIEKMMSLTNKLLEELTDLSHIG
jgi:protein-tyrosine phosphatase